MIFSDSPSQKAFERMMTQVKSFPPRGSGVVVLRHFEYTAEMCDCRLCLYYNRKRKCTVSQCPCIEERIVAGAASRAEVMAETMKNIHNTAFRRRLNQFIRESEELHMNFRNEKHRLAFVEAIRKLDKKNFALMSAVYLLTAEHRLWIAFTIKMSKKGDHQIDGYFDYVVPPLEGFWWQDGVDGIDYAHKENFKWVSVIRLPDFVTKFDFNWAVEEATKKKKTDFSKVEFLTYDEGLCVQCMHIGSYDDEPATVSLMHEYMEGQGYTLDITDKRLHHEIYLSDARKVAPEKLKTVIRHPIRKA